MSETVVAKETRFEVVFNGLVHHMNSSEDALKFKRDAAKYCPNDYCEATQIEKVTTVSETITKL